ncbi:MAG: response regulator, partial [Deltaproteobacteria bacterium]|nr:response regulator [Deltaproteobacteria bacterium]
TNSVVLAITGIPEEKLLGSHFVDIFSADDRRRVAELVKSLDDKPQITTGEFSFPLNGHQVTLQFLPIDEYSATSLVIINDITERLQAEADKKKLEAQLNRAQKMEAMGLMAGGVAHDLNNILSGIVTYPELLLLNLPEDSALRKPIKTIQESGLRAAGVVEDLMTMVRGAANRKHVLNLNTMVEEYLKSAEHQNLENIRSFVNFNTELNPNLLNISGSPIHMKKILMNLITNASEAVEGNGTVTITTVNQYLDEPLKGYENVRAGEYVILVVSDDGSGISPVELERIFEPFYTKKVMGRSGTGLGLAVVWNTVRDHNGYINVKSSEKGTVFELYFPVTKEVVVAEKEKILLENFLGHGEKILVVDDEEKQGEIASGILTELGYNTEAVSSGKEAIEYMKENAVDLIVLDMVMPKGINGRETYEAIIKIRPNQKAIIASGYAKTKDVGTSDGVVKSPIYCVAVIFQNLNILRYA